MSAEQDRPGKGRTIFLTIAISTLTTLVIGSMLYYTLKRHDQAHAQELDRMAVQASEQKAIAASQVFAAFSRRMIQADPARVQDLISAGLDYEGLRDVMIISRENMVLAAKNRAQVGQKLQDATWLSWKGQNREVAQRAVDQAGQPAFVIVEPLKERGDILAWVMLVFTLPQEARSLRSPMERMVETARLMVPILVFLLIGVGWAMKLASASIRKQIRSIMTSMVDEPAPQDDEEWLKKAKDEITRGAGDHRAA
jgi:hypothetical protein